MSPSPKVDSIEGFPAGFVWGVATAAAQIEGARDEDGRALSIWDTFAQRPGAIEDGSDLSVACDHYHRYRDDVAIMKSLGIPAYRFSVAWPRILPAGTGSVNEAGLDFYERLVDELLRADIQPWLTLYHWDLPQALEDLGGWRSRATVDAFAGYADVVSRRLGDRVQHWTTHNEPWCASVLGHAQGVHAPGMRDWSAALVAAHHLLLSHGTAVPALRANVPAAQVGITVNVSPCVPASSSQEDREAARCYDGELNRWFLDALYHGHYPSDMIATHRDLGRLPQGMDFVASGDMDVIQTPIDFLGINYYTRAVMRSEQIAEDRNAPRIIAEPDPAELTDMGWEVHPEGLTQILQRIHADYAPGPMFITENGAAYGDGPGVDGAVNDTARCDYVMGHVRACHDAIAAGVPLQGYFLWSLLDNFEWAFGYSKRFGIVWVDFATQKRTVKASAKLFSRIIRNDGHPREKAA